VLRRLGVEALAPGFVGAEDVPRGKPAPDGFLLGAARLGVPPEGCVVLEDSSAGIAAALAAGMTVVGVEAGNFAGQDQGGADLVVASLAEVDLDRLAALHEATHPRRVSRKVGT
jgi:sugar-phosphatase